MTHRNVVWKLVTSHLKHHPLRLALTATAIIATACTVVWIVSGYDALVSQFDDMADDYLGRYDIVIVPEQPQDEALGDALLAQLTADPDVLEAGPVFQSRVGIRKDRPKDAAGGTERSKSERPERDKRGDRRERRDLPGGAASRSEPGGNRRGGAMPRRGAAPSLVGTDANEPPYPLVTGEWFDPTNTDAFVGVLAAEFAEQQQIAVGDSVNVRKSLGGVGVADEDAEMHRVRIVGIVKQVGTQAALAPRGAPARGAARGPASAALYVPWKVAEKITGDPGRISFVGIKLKDTAAPTKFRSAWEERLTQASPAGALVTATEVEAGLDNSWSAQTLRGQAYAATGMSLLASLFILFTTLSMGVNERIRQFAVLRAVALTRGQVAKVIAVESMLLAMIGWIGGLAAGWALLQVMRRAQPELFDRGATIGWWCVFLSGVCAVGGSLLAAIVPMWRATNANPLEAMKPQSSRLTPMQLSWRLLAVGIVLIAINPLLVFYVPIADDAKFMASAVFGYTSMALGFLLLTPLAVLIAERWLGPIVAGLLGVDRRMLNTQLSSNLWRTVGASVALTIGLGLFVATQTWGISMLQPFVPGKWMPDLVVGFPKGISDADVSAVRQTAGVRADQCIPIAIEQPKLTGDITRSQAFTSATRADSVIIVGFDPQAALGGTQPMLDFTYVEGSRDAALQKLGEGRQCLIADFLQTETGLRVGDTLKLTPPNAPQTPLEYTVAGVVAEPGVHWLSKGSLRRRGGSMAGMVFTSYDQARRDFALTKNDFFWMNIEPTASVDEVQKALEPIALRNGGEAPTEEPFSGRTPVAGAGNPRSPVTVKSADAVGQMIRNRAAEVIWGFSQLPLVTLAIASIGMINTVMASVRARSWDFGVLRSVGLTRMGLFRVVIAEAILVGLVACLLSFALGVAAGYCGTGLSRYVYRHGGYVVPLVIPWARLAWACAATLGLCLIAALIPAIIAGRTEPVKLLQAGRAAT